MWGNNIARNPEKFGLEYVVEVELAEPDYSFDILGVWKNEQGYYLSTDSGCSCPSPWESHTIDDLTGPLTAEQAKEEATTLWSESYGNKYDPESFASAMALIV
jgi:hypothetical protein